MPVLTRAITVIVAVFLMSKPCLHLLNAWLWRTWKWLA